MEGNFWGVSNKANDDVWLCNHSFLQLEHIPFWVEDTRWCSIEAVHSRTTNKPSNNNYTLNCICKLLWRINGLCTQVHNRHTKFPLPSYGVFFLFFFLRGGVTKLNKTSHSWLWRESFLVTVVSFTASMLTLSLLTQKFCCLADCDVSKQDSSLLIFCEQ